MRILLDYRSALRERTGVGEYAHHLAGALCRQGSDAHVTLFSSSWKDRLAANAVPGASTLDRRIPVSVLNLAWHRLGWPPVEALGATADVVWSLHPLLMPTLGAAQVVTVHDLYFLEHPEATAREVRRDYAALAASHVNRADAVVANSEYTRRQVETKFGVPPEHITVCYPGAPAWRVREEPAAPGPILHVGTIEPRKNVASLVRAYLTLASHFPAVPSLIFAGRHGANAGALFGGDAQSAIYRTHVKFLGYVSDDERLRLYREASMLVIPSADEGFGLPALEAMTIGLPVVAASRGSLPEVLGGAGMLVDADDRVALADAMRRLLDDPALRREQAAKGVNRARHFNWDESATKLLGAFRDAITRKAARS